MQIGMRFDSAHRLVHRLGADLFLDAADGLALRLTSDDATGLPRRCAVVEEHLRRFAFREALAFAWNIPTPD